MVGMACMIEFFALDLRHTIKNAPSNLQDMSVAGVTPFHAPCSGWVEQIGLLFLSRHGSTVAYPELQKCRTKAGNT